MIKNKNTPLKTAICLSLLGTATTQAAWVWDPSTVTGDPLGTTGSSINTSITPGGAGYESGVILGNGGAWDITPEPVQFIISSTGGDVNFDIDPTIDLASGFLTYLELDVDPDGDGVVNPSSVCIEIIFPRGITDRGTPDGGAIGFLPTAAFFDGSFDVELSVELNNGTPAVIDSTYPYLAGGIGPFGPTSYSGGNAIWDNATNWAGLHDDNAAATQFPFATSAGAADPSKEIASMKYTLSDFNLGAAGDSHIRFSMDGGVSAFASEVVIPEPTSALLIAIGSLGFLARRKRS